MVAEIRGRGLDLSDHPFSPTTDDLGGIDVPTLVLSGDASYPGARGRRGARRSNSRARHVVVGRGHVIDPAHEVVLAFVSELGATGWSGQR
ncbi:hypothetical protein EKO23_05545 [Nocardioides guangzhouensis]|uniref:Alpha/beta hydrolase n=1 Tax=Nocardioides guangzhouensis TaxID=2497878 RepID=A0A4Q4ZH08_9ACTN|nr:hypothetical protein [Nocardioides guangzhouensis]RYP87502.1 hypothetical protein EKO23_05545 [Nocardioides guangzhouensis]